ncbi:hypothetical protein, partial [Dietzia aerolata]|uniref:hypothetical protein n=1 Tax=Dietzia aerolata TaxID=595984 RepID=UPI0019D517C9
IARRRTPSSSGADRHQPGPAALSRATRCKHRAPDAGPTTAPSGDSGETFAVSSIGVHHEPNRPRYTLRATVLLLRHRQFA